MSDFVSLNHQLQPRDQAVIGATSSALLYGRSVFTTVALRSGAPFLWNKHQRRLKLQSVLLGIETDNVDFERIAADLLKLAALNGHTDGRARVMIGARGGGIWSSESDGGNDIFIMTAARREQREPFRLTTSKFIVNASSPFAGLKCGNYLEPMAALADAKSQGFDEAIRANERGQIVSAALANIFWIRGGKLFTPPLETGCLAGTTREFVIESHGVTEMLCSIDELELADGIFLTSAGIGVCHATFGKSPATALDMIARIKSSLDSGSLY